MSKKLLRGLAAAGAGIAMLAAGPATAMTIVAYYSAGHLIVGYVIYGNDGHICEQSGTISSYKGTLHVDQDC